MRIRNLTLLIVLALVAIFAALNWQAITAPTSLSLGVADVQAPLGLVLLGIIVLLTVLFLLYIMTLQTAVLLEARRQSRELDESRKLADQAESSRLNELKLYIEGEYRTLSARMDQLEQSMKTALEESSNSITAYIAEVDDRLGRG